MASGIDIDFSIPEDTPIIQMPGTQVFQPEFPYDILKPMGIKDIRQAIIGMTAVAAFMLLISTTEKRRRMRQELKKLGLFGTYNKLARHLGHPTL